MKKLSCVLLVCAFILAAAGCGLDALSNTIAAIYDPPELEPTTAPTAIPAPERVQSTSTPVPTKPPETLPPIATPMPIIEEVIESTEALPETAYNSVLDVYRRAVSEQWDAQTCRRNDINYLVGMVQDKRGIGFCLKDIDEDGVAELFIGNSGSAEIYAMYTIVNGSVRQVIDAGERSAFYLEPDFAIVNSASGSAFQYSYIIYLFKNHTLSLSCAMVADYSVNEQEPWFLAYDLDWNISNDKKMSNQRAETAVKAYEDNYVYLTYTPIAG